MSKVIKSSSVHIRDLRIINIEDPEPDMDGESTEEAGGELAETTEEVNESVIDAEELKEQAKDILRETEQMVRELLETAREEAQKVLKSATEEAEQRLIAAQDQVDKIHADAYQRGHQEGYKAGLEAAESEFSSKIQEAEEIINAARIEKQVIIESSEGEIVRLAMAIARKVLGQELATNPQWVLEIVKRAIQNATDRDELIVRVSPENQDLALAAQDQIAQAATGIRSLKIKADPAVSRGGCVVETPSGTVDARIERQLDEIEQSLMEVSSNE